MHTAIEDRSYRENSIDCKYNKIHPCPLIILKIRENIAFFTNEQSPIFEVRDQVNFNTAWFLNRIARSLKNLLEEFEPQHEISNNVVCATAKPQISLRIRAV